MSEKKVNGLAVIETHPIQYHVPVYRMLQKQFNIPVTAVYGSDFSMVGYRDEEFKTTFAWDIDLVSGYKQIFLSCVSNGGARSTHEISARGLRRALRDIKPDAILIVGYSPLFHFIAFCNAINMGYPVLFRAETIDYFKTQSFIKGYLRDKLLSWLYKRSSKLLYIGSRSLQHFKRLGCPHEKLIFSPYSVDTSSFRNSEEEHTQLRQNTRKELNIKEGHIVVIFSGKLSHRKGPDILLTAVRTLPSEMRKNIIVLFMGNGELRDKLENMAYLPPSIQTRFVNFQNQTLLSRYYSAADILVLPSRYSEPWGLVVNEALYHGLPCIVSDTVGCAPDLIEEGITGYTFATNSAQDLAQALKKAFELFKKPQIQQDCCKKIKNFTIEKAAEGIAEAYNSILQDAKRRTLSCR